MFCHLVNRFLAVPATGTSSSLGDTIGLLDASAGGLNSLMFSMDFHLANSDFANPFPCSSLVSLISLVSLAPLLDDAWSKYCFIRFLARPDSGTNSSLLYALVSTDGVDGNHSSSICCCCLSIMMY
ncbi:hypothetical protein BpHYR1_039342 [Brachionus plicatilis]|uniref:Uncharacterized protein n=1 Tax=Brachionus plicatilis TaxID=10195 RepID=A0A3M7SV41_BRAPC|nr:hypothetical protein BpHYR1_039342 [Brachionus plicatilis]